MSRFWRSWLRSPRGPESSSTMQISGFKIKGAAVENGSSIKGFCRPSEPGVLSAWPVWQSD